MVKAILIIDGKEVNVRWFTINFNQGANPNGRPSQIPVFIGFKLIIETRKDLNLTEWAFSSRQTKQIVLHISSVIVGGKTRKIFFYDCHLVNWKTNFSSTGSDPMTETLEITCAGVEDSNSFGVYSASWRKTYKEENIEPTILDNNNEKEFTRCYITDLEENELNEYKTGDKILLNIESENRIGDNMTIFLDDKTHDFKKNGQTLENDTLKHTVSSNFEQIELEVIDQIN